MIAKKHILITGASGLLGRHVLAAWRGRHHLHAVVRRLPESPEPGVRYHCHDLAAPWTAATLPRSIDVVVHLAQARRMREFPVAAPEIFAVNAHATAMLLDYARAAGAGLFVLASTGGLYSQSASPLAETSPVDFAEGSLAYYFRTKYCAELMVTAYAAWMSTIILRPFFMYGPGQDEAMLIPRLITAVRTGKPVLLQGHEGMHLNPLYVMDAVQALTAALSVTGQHLINIAGSETVTMMEVATMIGNLLGIRPQFQMQDAPPPHLVADITRMCALLAAPRTAFSAGIAQMIDSLPSARRHAVL
ncbi:MAG: NAD(P)-dependent oxidoreductase [Alphaproteobacteria bacterium]